MFSISITFISARGTLWEGRYKATLLDSEQYLLTCMRYIELNPVRAIMVSQPEDYPWSSYHYNAVGVEEKMLTVARNRILSISSLNRSLLISIAGA